MNHPEALALLLLLPPLWLAATRHPRRLEGRRLWASLGLRSGLIACLILAVAGAHLRLPADAVTTIFLVDDSYSLQDDQRGRAEAFVRDALRAMRPDDRAGVVRFGGEALLASGLGGALTGDAPPVTPAGAATNIEAALQLGLALMPAEGHRRLVLLSDGVETAGDAISAAREAARRGVAVDVVPLGSRSEGLDAELRGVSLPESARAGQRLTMRLQVESSAPATALVVVTGEGGERVAQLPAQLRAGAQTLELELPEGAPSFNRYGVQLEVPGDARPQNNGAAAYTVVEERPRVLLVAEAANEARYLERALAAAQIGTITVTPSELPATIEGLAVFDAVALVDVPRHAVADEAVAALTRFVRDLGHGLLVVGGPSSFGAGGWRGSPLEETLPVTMDIPPKIEQPPASIVVLVDISGSMSEMQDGRTKLSLAVEGAQRVAELMRDEDELTVIPYDNEPVRVVGPIAGRDRARAVAELERVALGGGGINIRDGLAAAAEYVRRSDRPVRHIITLTDGDDTAQQEGARELLERLRSERVTLSSIAIGDGDHIEFIQGMARAGGGSYFFTERAADLPAILVSAAQEVMQPYVVEEPLTPKLGARGTELRGLRSAPPLQGFVRTTPRRTAQVHLASPAGDPLLASWRYGLGQATVWTSDMSTHWAGDWVRWNGFPEFAGQLVAAVLPPPGAAQIALRSEIQGGALVLRAQARDAVAATRSGLRVAAQLVGPDGAPRAVTMREVAPGVYEASERPPPGAYEVRLVALDRDGTPVDSLTGGAVMPGNPEYRGPRRDDRLLGALAAVTGGLVAPVASDMFLPTGRAGAAPLDIGEALLWLAVVLLPLDVAVRRQALDRKALAALAQRLRSRLPAPRRDAGQSSGAPLPQPVPVPVERDDHRRRRDEAA